MRVKLGKVPVDVITLGEAVSAIAELRHGTVFTPSLQHVLMAERHARLARAYARSTLSLADGLPIAALARLARTPLPERLDRDALLPDLVAAWARRGRSVFLVGPSHDVAYRAMAAMNVRGLRVSGVNTSLLASEPDEGTLRFLARQVARSEADAVLWSLGAPKQELWADAMRTHARSALHLCLGASLEAYVGEARRSSWPRRLAGLARLRPRYLRDAMLLPRLAIGSLLKRTG